MKINEIHDEEVSAVLEEKEENASITKSIHNSVLDGKSIKEEEDEEEEDLAVLDTARKGAQSIAAISKASA